MERIHTVGREIRSGNCLTNVINIAKDKSFGPKQVRQTSAVPREPGGTKRKVLASRSLRDTGVQYWEDFEASICCPCVHIRTRVLLFTYKFVGDETPTEFHSSGSAARGGRFHCTRLE